MALNRVDDDDDNEHYDDGMVMVNVNLYSAVVTKFLMS